MAVPGRRNGVLDEDDEGLFIDEDEWVALDDDDEPPQHRALAEAAEEGDIDALRLALDTYRGSIDDPVEDGDTVMHLCCLYGHLPCVQLLFERGASLESRDEDAGIPLHDACAGGFVEIVQFLISAAGNEESIKRMLDSVDCEGETPLHHATRGEHLEVVNLLLSLGASPKKTNINGKTPAELADPGSQVESILEAAAEASGSMVCQDELDINLQQQ